jgi:hypothetical protein
MSRTFRPLYNFLIETFNEAELRRFVATYYPDLAEEISARRVSRAELTTEVVDSLSRNHAVGGALFAALVEMRPRLGARIEELKRALASAEAVEAVPTVAARTESRQLDVMFVAANPVALPELQLSAEARRIEDKLRGTPGEHRIDIRYCWSAGPDSMIDMLYRGVPDVLHFAGHGAMNGAMLLQTVEGTAHPVTPDALAALLGARPQRPRMIVLNACYSVVMAQALLPLVDAVIGMRAAVEDVAARAFAVEFYRAIGHEYPIKRAFDAARAALRVHNLANDDLPQLDVRGIDARTYRLI